MDRPFRLSPQSSDSSRGSSPCRFNDQDKETVKPAYDNDTIVNMENFSPPQQSSNSSSPLLNCFQESCNISHMTDGEQSNCDLCTQNRMLTPSGSTESLKSKSDSIGSNCSSRNFSVEELGIHLTDFTTHFLQSGFSSLIRILKKVLMEDNTSTPASLDDSYFLWTVAFFLKFARRKEIEFKNLKEVFTTDVFGFLVFEAVNNGEEVLHLHKQNKPYNLNMRRLHLSVSALRELLKTLAFHRERGIPDGEMEYLENLQRQLSNMTDLRQLFLWLIRVYLPTCHSTLFLRDVIVTNHYFLLLLEEWLGKDFCVNKDVDMLSHVKQFAVGQVMTSYGCLLQSFLKNDHHVNNCIFTMMHHVAGDCLKPESLLQVNILKTFLQIWDTEVPITQEMNDLMEYVIQKFLSMAEGNPLSCALQLFSPSQDKESMSIEESDNDDGSWTQEEEDKLILWFVELENDSDVVPKLVELFNENGMKKSKLEVINHLYEMGWLSSEKLDEIVKSDKELQSLQKSPSVQAKELENDNLAILSTLSQMKEEEVVPSCVNKLVENGYQEQVSMLQDRLLEIVYIKMDDEQTPKKEVEEPVMKFFVCKGKAAPILFYNEDDDKFGRNIYTMALLDQMGFKMEDESFSYRYPRVPLDWTIPELIEKAEMLGDLNKKHLKFDLEMARTVQPAQMTEETPDFHKMDFSKKPQDGRKMGRTIQGAMWMKMVSQYNTEQAAAGSTTSKNMDCDK